jgi:hypothetical protein
LQNAPLKSFNRLTIKPLSPNKFKYKVYKKMKPTSVSNDQNIAPPRDFAFR